MRILWIEDQFEDNQEIWRRMEARQSKVSLASTIAEAILKLTEESFDYIVLDLRLPLGESHYVAQLRDVDYNGIYIVEFLESRELLGVIPVCALTNFVAVARQFFAGKPVSVIQKATFLKDFEEIIYGTSS